MTPEITLRRDVARDARLYLNDELSWEDFVSRYGETGDEQVSELVDLIEHEPQRGGVFGVSEDEWSLYRDRVKSLVESLQEPPVRSRL